MLQAHQVNRDPEAKGVNLDIQEVQDSPVQLDLLEPLDPQAPQEQRAMLVPKVNRVIQGMPVQREVLGLEETEARTANRATTGRGVLQGSLVQRGLQVPRVKGVGLEREVFPDCLVVLDQQDLRDLRVHPANQAIKVLQDLLEDQVQLDCEELRERQAVQATTDLKEEPGNQVNQEIMESPANKALRVTRVNLAFRDKRGKEDPRARLVRMVVLGRWVLLGTSGREAAMEHRDQLERRGHRARPGAKGHRDLKEDQASRACQETPDRLVSRENQVVQDHRGHKGRLVHLVLWESEVGPVNRVQSEDQVFLESEDQPDQMGKLENRVNQARKEEMVDQDLTVYEVSLANVGPLDQGEEKVNRVWPDRREEVENPEEMEIRGRVDFQVVQGQRE